MKAQLSLTGTENTKKICDLPLHLCSFLTRKRRVCKSVIC
jgi:hypothetical protein